jgi:hypothetical protein
MAERVRQFAYYLQEAAGVTSSDYRRLHDHPVLIWPQGEDWIERPGFQFETCIVDLRGDQTFEIPAPLDSHVKNTLIIEVRKQSDAAPAKMICVGRAVNNDIIFADTAVSKLHAYFVQAADSDAFYLVDASSTNGTEVNRRRLVPNHNHLLVNRDRIRFGPNVHVMYLTTIGFFEMLHQFHRAGIM